MEGHKRHIVIVGGGIIGCTTAYFLTRHPKFNPDLHRIVLLEASSIAAGASGKAGGLLALWAYPDCLVSLSYRLHADLAAEHDGARRWGYRRVACGSVDAVVPEAALKECARMSPAGPDARADAQQVQQPVEMEEAQQPPAPSPSAINGNGPADGAASSDPLPIQSTMADQQSTTSHHGNTGEDKEWEKLPKQDDQAASLLHDSPLPPDLDWIDGRLVQRYTKMGVPGATETAQVHPFQFTTAMAQLARERGVDIRLGARVTKIHHSKTEVHGVEYEDRRLAAAGGEVGQANGHHMLDGVTDVVVAAGPWTGHVLPRSKVEGLRAHSVVFDADVSPYAVFTNIGLPSEWAPEHRARRGQRRRHRGNVDPEMYARPGREVYACGEPDSAVPLPETADAVQVDAAQCDDLAAYIGTVSPALAAAPVKARQACYLPRHIRFGEERSPLVGATLVPGLWVASGHTCWGIQNGPATGCLLAEMLLDGEARSADVERLDPRKFKV